MSIRHRYFMLPLALLALGGCASSAVRYVDDQGKEYAGTLDAATNSQTAHIDGKVYRGPFKVNEWSQGKSILTGPGEDRLRCDFHYQVLKFRGTCETLTGREYQMMSR